jgi:hypothetical protein
MFKQAFGVFIAVSGLSTAAMAQTPASPDAGASCALPNIAASVELDPVAGSKLVTVPVEINGKPKQFLLVAGTGLTMISQATVRDLKLVDDNKRTEVFQTDVTSIDDTTEMRDFTVNSTIAVNMVDARNARAADGKARVRTNTFTIGGATGKNLSFAVASDTDIAKSAPYDGILTGDFFKQYDVELDFARMKLTYLTPNTCSDPHRIAFWPHGEVAIIPMDMVDGQIQVQVEIAGHKIDAMLDTGSERTVMRRDIAENEVGLKADSPQMPPAGDLRDGKGMQVYTASLPKISFAGGVTAFNVPAMVQANSMTHNLHKEAVLGSRAQFKADPRIPAMTLGMDVLRQLHLYVVYGQNMIYMTAAE